MRYSTNKGSKWFLCASSPSSLMLLRLPKVASILPNLASTSFWKSLTMLPVSIPKVVSLLKMLCALRFPVKSVAVSELRSWSAQSSALLMDSLSRRSTPLLSVPLLCINSYCRTIALKSMWKISLWLCVAVKVFSSKLNRTTARVSSLDTSLSRDFALCTPLLGLLGLGGQLPLALGDFGDSSPDAIRKVATTPGSLAAVLTRDLPTLAVLFINDLPVCNVLPPACKMPVTLFSSTAPPVFCDLNDLCERDVSADVMESSVPGTTSMAGKSSSAEASSKRLSAKRTPDWLVKAITQFAPESSTEIWMVSPT
mmetsp:Transcript_44896/g.106548  ORF Transcript_44896/g.106548 Transcript_44896/m.106548 type:complete len:311 (-) Transcript_44896:2636-3568(-)